MKERGLYNPRSKRKLLPYILTVRGGDGALLHHSQHKSRLEAVLQKSKAMRQHRDARIVIEDRGRLMASHYYY